MDYGSCGPEETDVVSSGWLSRSRVTPCDLGHNSLNCLSCSGLSTRRQSFDRRCGHLFAGLTVLEQLGWLCGHDPVRLIAGLPCRSCRRFAFVMFILCDKDSNLYFKSFFYVFIISHHYLSHIFSPTQACTYFIAIYSLLSSEIQFPLGGIFHSHFTHIVSL
jgi:hypothetical protein